MASTRAIMISDDGVTFTLVSTPWDDVGIGNNVAWGDYIVGGTDVALFAAAGNVTGGGDSILTSSDGSTWAAPSSNYLNDQGNNVGAVPDGSTISSGDSGFLAHGSHAPGAADALAKAVDGTSWVNASEPFTISGGHPVSDGSSVWVVMASSGVGAVFAYTSSLNPGTWGGPYTTHLSAGPSTTVEAACTGYNSGRFLVGGFSANSCLSTSDNSGVTWTQREAAAFGQFTGLAYSPALGIWCGCGVFPGPPNNGFATSSNNGTSWTAGSDGLAATEGFKGIAWSPSLAIFLAVADTGHIFTSPDGVTWTQQTTTGYSTGLWLDVTWSGELGLFVIVGQVTLAAAGGWVIGGVSGAISP